MTTAFEHSPTLLGETLRVRPVVAQDFEAIYAVARDPVLWEQHPAKTRHQRDVFQNWFEAALPQHALIVEQRSDGLVIGTSRYYEWNAVQREVAIGFTFISRSHWGGVTNRELKSLMLAHAFRFADTVWFHVNPENTRSRMAMLKIGGKLSHITSHVIFDGPPTEYAFFRIDRAATD